MGFARIVAVTTLYLSILVVYLHFAPNLLDFQPQPVKLEPMKSFEGKYAPNEKLSKAERTFEGILEGPESFVVHKGSIYTGLRTGEIVRINGDKISKIAQIGKGDPTEGVWTEKTRGRPLGLRLTRQGKLLVADAYYGLHQVDIDTGDVKALLPIGQAVGGKPLKFPNDLCVDDTTGVIYLSDSSTRWGLDDIVHLVLENEDSGRIIRYDPKTGQSSVFAEGLRFANGVQITHDGKGLLVSEINGNAIWKYHLTGAKKGERELFARLPGSPDNIRASPRGGYWVALVSAGNASSTPTLAARVVSQDLSLKRILARFFHGLGRLMDLANSFYHCDCVKDLAYRIQKLEFLLHPLVNYCMIVELDASGKVLQTLHSSDKRMCFLSEVLEHNGHLYVGSFLNHYLIKLKV